MERRSLLHTPLRVGRNVFVNRSEESEKREFSFWERSRAEPLQRGRRVGGGRLKRVDIGAGAEEVFGVGCEIVHRHFKTRKKLATDGAPMHTDEGKIN